MSNYQLALRISRRRLCKVFSETLARSTACDRDTHALNIEVNIWINMSWLEQNGRHFADDIIKRALLKWCLCAVIHIFVLKFILWSFVGRNSLRPSGAYIYIYIYRYVSELEHDCLRQWRVAKFSLSEPIMKIPAYAKSAAFKKMKYTLLWIMS